MHVVVCVFKAKAQHNETTATTTEMSHKGKVVSHKPVYNAL
jgi:hypothetical protein